MKVELWAYAEVLPVRLRLVPAAGTGHLETLVLRAVAAGIGDIDTLTAMFGLSSRLILDVVGDLWRAGRVGLDDGAGTESIVLTGKGETELADLDESGTLPSGYRVTDSRQVLLEKLTGRILPLRLGRPSPEERSLVIPMAADDPSRADVNPEALVSAAMADLEDRRRGRNADQHDGMRVVSATVSPEAMMGVAGRGYRYVRITVEVRRTQHDGLDVEVVEESVPLALRLLATRRLNAALSSDPQPPLARRLRQLAPRVPFRPFDASAVVAELQRRAEALVECAPANRQREHDWLAGRTRDLYHHARSRAQQELDVSLLQSEGDHRAALSSLIGSAEHQLVLAVPWVHEKALLPYLDPLIAAVSRGCHVFLLWGIRAAGESLPSEVKSHLIDIRRRATAAGRGGDLHYADLPSLLHAKVALADDRRALVTSRNFFSNGMLKELGVLLEAPGDRRAPLLEDLLGWAHRVAPSAVVADRLARHGTGFGSRSDGVDVPDLALPQFGKALVEAPAGSALVRSWTDGWRAVVHGLDHLLRRDRPVVSLVVDGLHRALLEQALGTASRRIVVASDGFSSSAVSREAVDAARDAAANGVDVTFVYARGKDEDAGQRLRDLVQSAPEGLVPIVRKVGDHHAKVLLWDDSVVIGSYNYLSRESSRRRGRSTGEVSVQIDAPSFADLVADKLQRAVQGAAEPALTVPAAQQPRADAPALSVALATQRVVEMLSDEDASPERVAAEVQSCDAVDDVLALIAGQAGEEYLERALGALVHTAPENPEWHRWLQRLVHLTWRRAAWWASTRLREALDPGLDGPSERLATVAGASPAVLAELLTQWVDTDVVPVPEREALSLLGVVALLRSGDLALQEPLALWQASCRPATQRLVRTALEGTATFGALPTVQLMDGVRNASAQARLATSWEALDRAVGELRRYKPHSPEGDQLLEFLFGRDVLHRPQSEAVDKTADLAQLERAIELRDPIALATWTDAHLDRDDRRWLDRAGSRAGLGRAIDDGRRTSFINKYAAIRRAVEDVGLAARDVRTITALAPGQLTVITVLERELGEAGQTLPGGWDSDLARAEIDRLLTEIRGERPSSAPGGDLEVWRFPRIAVPREDTSAASVARLVAADLCSAWTAPGAVEWLIGAGEFALAETMIHELGESRVIGAEAEAALGEARARAQAEDSARLESAWALIRARADCAGIPLPASWPEAAPRRSATARRLHDEAKGELERGLTTLREELISALHHPRRPLDPARENRIRLLIDADELVAARRALDGDDDGIELVPVLASPPAWPFRSMHVPTLVYQLRNPAHRYPAVEAFIPVADDVDAQRFVTALSGLESPGEAALSSFVEAVQLMVEEPGVPRRLRRWQRDDNILAGDDRFTTTFVIPHHPTLPRMRWVGTTVTVSIGTTCDGPSLFCLAPQIAAPPWTERVVDIAALLPLLVPHEGQAPSRPVRALRFLRALCAQLSLAQIVDPDALEPLESADARVRLWTLLHVLGFDLDDVARASIVAAAGDHPRLLWRLVEAGLTLLRDPDVPAAQLDARWDTTRLLARYDFDALVRRAIEDEVEVEVHRAVLAAVAYVASSECSDSSLIVDYVVLAGRSPADREELARVITVDVVEQAVARLQELRYVQRDAAGLLSLRDDLVGRSLQRNHPAQWLEDLASAVLATAISPEERLVREFSHEWLQSYRSEGADPQRLAPADIRNPDVPCWASRWAALMVRRQEVHNWFTEDGISVQNDIEPDLWIPGPATAFGLTVRNILQNARTALLRTPPSDDRGRVVLSVSAEPQTGKVRLEVADNGPGFPDTVRDMLNRGESLQRGRRGYGLAALQDWAGALGWEVRADRHTHLGGAQLVVRIPRIAAPDAQWSEPEISRLGTLPSNAGRSG